MRGVKRHTFAPGRLLLVASTALCLLAAAPIAAGSHRSEAMMQSLPTCPKKLYYGINPHPACLFRSFQDPGAVPVTGTIKVSGLTKVVKGILKTQQGLFYDFSVTATFHNGYTRICPQPQTPIDAIPCHFSGVSVAIVGKYVHGSKTLSAIDLGSTDVTSCSDTSPCVRHYRASVNSDAGQQTFVVQVKQGDLTKNASNDLGSAGFEVPIVVTVPKPKSTH